MNNQEYQIEMLEKETEIIGLLKQIHPLMAKIQDKLVERAIVLMKGKVSNVLVIDEAFKLKEITIAHSIKDMLDGYNVFRTLLEEPIEELIKDFEEETGMKISEHAKKAWKKGEM